MEIVGLADNDTPGSNKKDPLTEQVFPILFLEGYFIAAASNFSNSTITSFVKSSPLAIKATETSMT